mmetsp:Transcript_1590/g.4599  ORF Transcript_1590/g.4599 Transcript_1590/m.4599 type:complete len:215 (+) Transcript_1590:267-911(+)
MVPCEGHRVLSPRRLEVHDNAALGVALLKDKLRIGAQLPFKGVPWALPGELNFALVKPLASLLSDGEMRLGFAFMDDPGDSHLLCPLGVVRDVVRVGEEHVLHLPNSLFNGFVEGGRVAGGVHHGHNAILGVADKPGGGAKAFCAVVAEVVDLQPQCLCLWKQEREGSCPLLHLPHCLIYAGNTETSFQLAYYTFQAAPPAGRQGEIKLNSEIV